MEFFYRTWRENILNTKEKFYLHLQKFTTIISFGVIRNFFATTRRSQLFKFFLKKNSIAFGTVQKFDSVPTYWYQN